MNPTLRRAITERIRPTLASTCILGKTSASGPLLDTDTSLTAIRRAWRPGLCCSFEIEEICQDRAICLVAEGLSSRRPAQGPSGASVDCTLENVIGGAAAKMNPPDTHGVKNRITVVRRNCLSLSARVRRSSVEKLPGFSFR